MSTEGSHKRRRTNELRGVPQPPCQSTARPGQARAVRRVDNFRHSEQDPSTRAPRRATIAPRGDRMVRRKRKPLGACALVALGAYVFAFAGLLRWIYLDHKREQLRKALKAERRERVTIRKALPRNWRAA